MGISNSSPENWHGTTILTVRKGGKVVIAGDGQVTLGQTIVKGNAKKVRSVGNGNVIARDHINFGRYTAANFPYRMRQKASDDNALGLVKFIFPNPWNIYLHDTPDRNLFDAADRRQGAMSRWPITQP